MTVAPSICPLCIRPVVSHPTQFDGIKISCDHCGRLQIVGSATPTLETLDQRSRNRIGFWTRDQNELGEIATVTTMTIDTILARPEISIMDRADRLLRFGISRQVDLGETFPLITPGTISLTHSQTGYDVIALAELLNEAGFLKGESDTFRQVTPQGFIQASQKVTSSNSGFIAMWFDKSMASARMNGLEEGILRAGYQPVIVDGVEHINKIDDEIVSQIRKSKFLVADFTGHRGGVYFEAGFALGLGLPIFWTCRKDDMANLHFDIRQYNCIDWADPADLAKRLHRRLEAILGRGRSDH